MNAMMRDKLRVANMWTIAFCMLAFIGVVYFSNTDTAPSSPLQHISSEEANLRIAAIRVMCYARLLVSGVPTVYYYADDFEAGMCHLWQRMPPKYQERIKHRKFQKLPCSPELEKLANDIYQLGFQNLGNVPQR